MKLRADWMSGRYGLMVHYLPPLLFAPDGSCEKDPERVVRQFDVKTFMQDFDATGADWLIFTFGQNTGFYNAPNPVIDRYAGTGHTARRHLAREIAAALKQRGKRFLAYLPCEIAANTALQRGFAWNRTPGTAQSEFQRRWCEVIRFWAEELGSLLDGWWFDGCYAWDIFSCSRMLWLMWYEAARAGNPDAVVTFNHGVISAAHIGWIADAGFDYYAGETAQLWENLPRLGEKQEGFQPQTRTLPQYPQTLWHLLFPVDAFWWHGAEPPESLPPPVPFLQNPAPDAMEPPLYDDDRLLRLLRSLCGKGAGVTMNVGIFANGAIGRATRQQLQKIRRARNHPAAVPPAGERPQNRPR